MADEGTADANAAASAAAAAADTQTTAATPEANGPATVVKHETFGELEKDTADWLSKRTDIKDVKSLAKIARDKDSMVGKQAEQLAKAIVIPGKDATPEERAAYREKMGIGATADDYAFEVPKDLPETLPYDGERAKAFGGLAAEIGLTKAQAQKVHDWAASTSVADFNAAQGAEQQRLADIGAAETAKLVKLYGPVDGEVFKTNAAFADKALALGSPADVQELMDRKLIVEIGGKKVVQSAGLFNLFAKVGQSLFTEGEVVRGDPTQLGNPFADGDQENLTLQARVIQSDPNRAKSLIAAAGKKPADFGIKA